MKFYLKIAISAAALACAPAELSWRAGVDLLSFGATKGGALGAEAIVAFDEKYAEEIIRRRKRGGAHGDDQVAMRYGEWEARRTIYMDGRVRPHDAAPSLLGHSVGRWESETLFIETSGISANITMRFEHSGQLRTTERYTRSEDGQTLWLTATLADPQSLMEPLVVKKLWRWAPEAQITPRARSVALSCAILL